MDQCGNYLKVVASGVGKELKLCQHKTNDKKPTAEDRVGALELQTFPDVHTIDERASVSLIIVT